MWCSFEAAIVQIRHIPVAVAGYDVSMRQRALAAWGSLLTLPPWAKDHGDREITRLGQANSACLFFNGAARLSTRRAQRHGACGPTLSVGAARRRSVALGRG